MTQHEAFLQCPKCGGRPYRLLRVQNKNPDGTPLDSFGYDVECLAGATKPLTMSRIKCPDCGEELKRA